MSQTSSLYLRMAVALAATVGLFVAAVFLFPDSLPILPAIMVPIWIGFFSGNRQYDERARRVLSFAAAAGVAVFLVGIVAFVLAS